MAVLELGVDMFGHDLSTNPQLAMYLVNVDKRTVGLLVLEPSHLEDGSSGGSSQAGNVTAVREYLSNWTRHYTVVDDRAGRCSGDNHPRSPRIHVPHAHGGRGRLDGMAASVLVWSCISITVAASQMTCQHVEPGRFTRQFLGAPFRLGY